MNFAKPSPSPPVEERAGERRPFVSHPTIHWEAELFRAMFRYFNPPPHCGGGGHQLYSNNSRWAVWRTQPLG